MARVARRSPTAARTKSPEGTARPAPRGSVRLAPTPRWAWLGLAGLVALAYGNAVPLGLAVDGPFLLANPRLAAVTADNVELILTRPYWWPSHTDDLYRPLTTLSFLLGPGGVDRPWLLHLTNVLLHALNVWLAFRLGLRVMGSAARAAAVAALFAVHPIGTDTVTNVAGRADLLACAAVLGGLLAHARSLEDSARAGRWRLLLGGIALGGVFSKENAVVLLPVLMLYDVAFVARAVSLRETLLGAGRRGRASYAIVGLALVAMALVRRGVMSDELPHWQPFGDNPLTAAGFGPSRLTALGVLGHNFLLYLWPAALSADYSYDQIPIVTGGAPLALAIGSAVALLLLAALAWRFRVTRPALFFWVFFALGTRLPTANLLILIGSVMAERFLYLPSLGLAGALVTVGALALERIAARPGAGAARWPRVAFVGLAVVLIALAARTIVRNRDWRDDETIWRSAIRVCPDSNKPYKGLARVLYGQGRLDEAIARLEQSLAIFDRRPLPAVDYSSDLLQALGEYQMEKGDELREAGRVAEGRARYAKAMAVLERAERTDRATNERVRLLRRARGEEDADIQDVGVLKIHETLGAVALRLGEVDRARSALQWHRHLDPTHASPYVHLAAVEAAARRGEEEAVLLLEAMILEPDSAEVWAALTPVSQREGIRGLGHEAGRLRIDVADPRLSALVARACPDLEQVLWRARRASAAGEAESICRQRLGYRPAVPRP
jgi:protein O-mannosyl-transferase